MTSIAPEVATTTPTAEVELAIGGMTCASCAARIEKKLNRMADVAATVNFATERAKVTYGGGVEVADLIATVERTGYTAAVPQPVIELAAGGTGVAAAGEDGAAAEPGSDEIALRQRMITSIVLAVPVIVLSMIPALQFDNWQWLALTLASPVVVYGGWPFHQAAWKNLRHGAATMDTLISVGTAAAFLFNSSVFAR